MNHQPPVVIDPASEATHAIIWLHGLGADGFDFVPIARELEFARKGSTRFVFPHALHIPVTINNGHVMPAWFDIVEIRIDREVDHEQLEKSSRYIRTLIDDQIRRGVPAEHILLAGFSQGGAVAIDAALTFAEPLAGLLVLSSYFATAKRISTAPANRKIPVLIQHGTDDPIVPASLGQMSHQILTEQGYPATYQTFPMGHSVSPSQIFAISQWLDQVL